MAESVDERFTPSSLPSPEEVIANRGGDVLIKHTVLKADHFPSKLPCFVHVIRQIAGRTFSSIESTIEHCNRLRLSQHEA